MDLLKSGYSASFCVTDNVFHHPPSWSVRVCMAISFCRVTPSPRDVWIRGLHEATFPQPYPVRYRFFTSLADCLACQPLAEDVDCKAGKALSTASSAAVISPAAASDSPPLVFAKIAHSATYLALQKVGPEHRTRKISRLRK